MITEIAVERVEFRCPESHWCAQADYDLVLYQDAVGDIWELYSLDGVPTPSPYTVDGAPFCPECHRAVVGRPVARRFVPTPGEDGRPPGRPGRSVGDLGRYRDEREDLPLLSGRQDG
jgi:hypothetical protein